jgi:hypothetical protein
MSDGFPLFSLESGFSVIVKRDGRIARSENKKPAGGGLPGLRLGAAMTQS